MSHCYNFILGIQLGLQYHS